MTQDYGVRSKRRWTLLNRLVLPAVGLVIVLGGLSMWWGQRQGEINEARDWLVSGPACPTLSSLEDIGFTPPPLDTFQFDGVRISRAYGHVNCREIAEQGGVPVCRFNSPMVLEVNAPSGPAIYWTKISPATVSIVQGRPSCVLGAGPGFR